MTARKKKVLAVALAVMGIFGGLMTTAGTFNAQTRNPGSAFSSGTLVLSNTKLGGSACLSTAGGSTDTNVNNACDQLINLTVRKPGDSGTGKVTLSNNGSLGASALNLYTSSCVTANAPAESFNGTGDMCASLIFYVQRYSDAGFTTKSSCIYGGGTATVCDFSDSAKTLSAFTAAFTSGSPNNLGALTAGTSGYYEIGVQLPSSAGNSLQGRQSTFDLTWVLQQ